MSVQTRSIRRLLLFGFAFLMSVATLGCSRDSGTGDQTNVPAISEDLVVVTYGGGAYQQSHITAFIEPYREMVGVNVESVVWGAEYGRLAEMVRSGRVVWDVVEVTAAQFERGVREELFERLAVAISDSIFQAVEGSPGVNAYGVPNVYWSTVLAYRADKFSGEVPENWTDFWNVERFPGPRAIYDDPRGNLEFALLADGVSIDSLYPLDVERAFRKMEELKPHIRVWWSDGTEPVRLLLNDQVALTSAWSGRIFASEQAKQEISYRWNGAAHELDYWVVPRGSENVARASEFIRFASEPGPMARQAELTAYGPSNSLAVSEVPEEILPHLPTSDENWQISFVINSEWWAQNEGSITERWIRWKNQ